MIGGSWMVENVWEELDSGGEYFFNESTSMLYIIPNTTYMQRIYVVLFSPLEQLLGLVQGEELPVRGGRAAVGPYRAGAAAAHRHDRHAVQPGGGAEHHQR